jgi:phage tail sheath protein FI
MKTPGVYVAEKNAFPHSVVEVATAVPAFIGYTETATVAGRALRNVPHRIASLADYHACFGGAPAIRFGLSAGAPEPGARPAASVGGRDYYLSRRGRSWQLYYGMVLFFQNGGGTCYVVSVGDYEDSPDADRLVAGIDALLEEQEPTLVVVPDAVRVGDAEACARVQRKMLDHCATTGSRFAILDVYDGSRERSDDPDCVAGFRDTLGADNLSYGAAYYPWLETDVTQNDALSYEVFDTAGRAALGELVGAELGLGEDDQTPGTGQQAKLIERLDDDAWTEEEQADLAANKALLNQGLRAASSAFRSLLDRIRQTVNLLPPSGAIAGIYSAVDNSRGVWKAPANVGLNGVLEPSASISHEDQEDLNAAPRGASVNAIRSFPGKGTLVWGARTLDGNSLDWRYVPVRRTVIMLEQSIKLASKAFVFGPNTADTWVTLKSMIGNFLMDIWRRGGLAGAAPDEAFGVRVGLGETMTPEDVRAGILRIAVYVALVRPAEFIELTFEQQMQQS